MTKKLRFVDKNRSEFFATVRSRVDNYFTENNLSRHANGHMVFKSVFFIGGLVLTYGLIMSNQFGLWTMLGLAILCGMLAAFIGFNVCHDAIHGSYSANPNVNKAFSILFNVIGANPYVWSVSHNVVHHTYTNIHHHDEDLEVAPGLVRLSPTDKINFLHRFQHYYAFLLYGLASLSWVMRKDYVKMFAKKIGEVENNVPRKEFFNLFLFKGIYYTLFIVLPLIFLDITWWQFIIGFMTMHFFEGLTLGLVFQLAHVVEGVEFPEPNTEGNIDEAWAVHQMQTTANFSTGSWLANFLCGGLNFQIEHHLFPKVCHVHYVQLSKIVRSTAREYGVPYIEHPTFFKALKSHFNVLKKFGRAEQMQVAYA